LRKLLWIANAFFCVCFLLAPQLAPYDESEQHRAAAMRPPTALHILDSSGHLTRPFVIAQEHRYVLELSGRSSHIVGIQEPAYWFVFGSDEYGRDLFSRFLYGGRRAVLVGGSAALGSVLIGFAVGAVAGMSGGLADTILMRCSELFLSLPWIYLLLAIRALLPLRLTTLQSLAMIASVATLAGWPRPARIVRGVFLSVKQRPYVSVARSLGAGDFYLVTRHIFPEVRGLLLTQAASLLPQFMLVDVAFSFLGLGGNEQQASWGEMLGALRHFSVVESHGGFLMVAVGIALVIFLMQLAVESE